MLAKIALYYLFQKSFKMFKESPQHNPASAVERDEQLREDDRK